MKLEHNLNATHFTFKDKDRLKTRPCRLKTRQTEDKDMQAKDETVWRQGQAKDKGM